MNPLYNNIPDELKALPQWVYWTAEERNGKLTKIPKNARSGFNADVTNPATWSSFDQAVRSSINGAGIGFVFTLASGYVGLDIDEKVEEGMLDWFNTYAEKSYSGKGVHIIMKGTLPDYMGKKQGRRSGKYELYCQERYFCMTGNVVHNTPIIDCQDKINEFIASYFVAPLPIEKPVDISAFIKPVVEFDSDVITEIRGSAQGNLFDDLWNGGTGKCISHSEADMALLGILHWWTGGDKQKSFSLFRQSPRAQRDKMLKRGDYLLDKAWNKFSGESVRESIMTLPPSIVKAKSESPWRKITIEHVEQAITGTILDPMVKAFCSPMVPALPLETGLAKALVLCGCALSGKAQKPRDLQDMIGQGATLARVRIMTANGQVPNFWTLLCGDSASGKDVGNLLGNAAKQFKWIIGGSGSEEGIADAYVRNPVGLMSISEMSHYLDENRWQSRATGFLTAAFNQGYFTYALSKRGDCSTRETNYCYPNIQACIQEKALQHYATTMHLETGFLGRFIIMKMPDVLNRPACGDLTPQLKTIVNIAKVLSMKSGDIAPPDDYSLPLLKMFYDNKAEPRSMWKRLCNEYYPRLALILSCSPDDTSPDVSISNDGWQRAEILVKYFFAQAEEIFSSLHFDQNQTKLETLCKRILTGIQKAPHQTLMRYEISQNFGRGTCKKERDSAITELLERGQIRLVVSEKNKGAAYTSA